MVDDFSEDFKDIADVILEMSLKDFFKACSERGIDFTLVISAISVCSFKLLYQMALDEKNKN